MDTVCNDHSSVSATLDLQELAMAAYARLQAKDFAAAIPLLQQRLELAPQDRYARQMLGVALAETGRLAHAAVLLWPLAAEAWAEPGLTHNLGRLCGRIGAVHLRQDRPEAAERSFRLWTGLEPDNVAAWWALATLAQNTGQDQRAQAFYQRILQLRPDHEDAAWNLGLLAVQADQRELAQACFQRVFLLNPGNGPAILNFAALALQRQELEAADQALAMLFCLGVQPAGAWYNLAELRVRQGCLDAACVAYWQAEAAAPGQSRVLHRLGTLLFQNQQSAAAEAVFRRLLVLEPGSGDAVSNLAIALRHQNGLDEALTLYRWALQINPDQPAYWYNQGIAQANSGAIAAAEVSFRETLKRMPEHEGAHHLLGQMRLLQGDYREGAALYEWRPNNLAYQASAKSRHGLPLWDGTLGAADPSGRYPGNRLVLMGEGGIGDILQFMRYAPWIAATGVEVVLYYRADLEHLLKTLPNPHGRLIHNPASMPGCYGAGTMALSLPYRCRTTLDTIPATVPYLSADPQRIARWRPRLAAQPPGLRVGLAWETRGDQQRSVPIAALLEALLPVAGVCLVSLQKGLGAEELNALPEAVRSRVLQLPLDEDDAVFGDTAAVMAGLDLVISIDTAAAHLAGALGCQTWVLLYQVPDWRWMLDREDSPWYPTVRLFRQEQRGDWTPVLDRLAAALRRQVAQRFPAVGSG